MNQDSYSARLTKYLHLSIQILWFDYEEFVLLISLYVSAMVLSNNAIWIACLIIPFIAIPYKRKAQRGYLKHKAHHLGFGVLDLYPDPSAKKFHE